MTDVELSLCVPTVDVYGESCHGLVQSARATLIDVAHEIVLVENRRPMQGVTDPLNASIRAARGRFIVVANDDVVLTPDWWPALREELAAGGVVARPYTADKGRFGWWLFAMRRELVDQLSVEPGEFWDRRFKLWYQDADFEVRLSRASLIVANVSSSIITHRESQSHDVSDPSTAAQISEDHRRFHEKWSS